MAVLTMNWESQFLGGRHPLTVILPDTPRSMKPADFFGSGRKYKVLWLLHGTFGNDTDWLRRTMIEVYACEHNLAVVMPSALNSDFVNWNGFGCGFHMYDYMFDDLMPMCYNWLPISDRREDNYIAGLSMGGMGTMVYALGHPEKFAVAASLSGPIMDPRKRFVLPNHGVYPHMVFRPDRTQNQINNAGGMEGYLASEANTWDRLISLEESGADLPKLYFCIGTDDFLMEPYNHFKDFVKEKGWNIEFEEEPGFRHEWRFWDMYIEKIIKRFVPREEIEGLSF